MPSGGVSETLRQVVGLVVVSGLPGTGKSTISAQLAIRLGACLYVKDIIETALWRKGVGRELQSSWVAHEVLTSLTRDTLTRGKSVIIDSVATTEVVRRDWRAAAESSEAAFVVVVCGCSDGELHRRRLDGRDRGIAGWPELTWADVEAVARRWEPWADEHLNVDAANAIEDNVKAACDYVARRLDI